jgi:hypothetical protein
MDIDFLIPNPAKIHKDINIPEILCDRGRSPVTL